MGRKLHELCNCPDDFATCVTTDRGLRLLFTNDKGTRVKASDRYQIARTESTCAHRTKPVEPGNRIAADRGRFAGLESHTPPSLLNALGFDTGSAGRKEYGELLTFYCGVRGS